jgi:hypothetical protein
MNKASIRADRQYSPDAWTAIGLAAGTVLFTAPLLLPIGSWPWLTLHFADAAVVVCLLLAAVALFADRHATDRRVLAVLAALVLGVFGFALAVKWRSGLSVDVLQLGLLPSLDAEKYVRDAVRLLNVGALGDFASRRPLAPSHLAGLFLLDGANLRLTMALLVAACALATLGVVAALRARFGLHGALAAMAVLFAFIYPTLGTAMTESLGYILGCAGFVLMWHGAARGKPWLVVAGIAFFSVGVLARAGALFMLPALALWMGYGFRRGKRLSFKWTAAAIAAGLTGFVANGALAGWVAAPGQVPFANFALTFYGLADGGQPWNHIFQGYPQLWDTPDADQARIVYRMAFDHIAAHPLDLVRGILYRYNDFLFNVEWHKYVPNGALRLIVLAFSVTGLVAAWRRRADCQASLLLAAYAGIFLSVPFLGDGGPRVFAASHAFTAAFAASGMAVLQRRFGRAPVEAIGNVRHVSAMPIAITIFAAVPILALASSRPSGSLGPLGQLRSCADGKTAADGRMLANAAVTVCPTGDRACHGVPSASIAATNIWHAPLIAQIAATERPITVFKLVVGQKDRVADNLLTVVSDPAAMPAAGAVAACVTPDGDLSKLVR